MPDAKNNIPSIIKQIPTIIATYNGAAIEAKAR